jgi:hypothetical protein
MYSVLADSEMSPIRRRPVELLSRQSTGFRHVVAGENIKPACEFFSYSDLMLTTVTSVAPLLLWREILQQRIAGFIESLLVVIRVVGDAAGGCAAPD